MNSPLRDAVARFQDAHGRTPTVLLDMDGVLFEWEDFFVQTWREMFPHLPTRDAGQRSDYDLFADLSDDEVEAMLKVMDALSYHRIPVADGAVRAVSALADAGADLGVCSAPWLTNPTCASEKLTSVHQHFGIELAKATVLTRDKTLVFGDILVDDKPEIHGMRDPSWRHIYFTQTYNRGLPGHRIDSWAHGTGVVAAVLDELAAGR